jgi:hypothetical protein
MLVLYFKSNIGSLKVSKDFTILVTSSSLKWLSINISKPVGFGVNIKSPIFVFFLSQIWGNSSITAGTCSNKFCIIIF